MAPNAIVYLVTQILKLSASSVLLNTKIVTLEEMESFGVSLNKIKIFLHLLQENNE